MYESHQNFFIWLGCLSSIALLWIYLYPYFFFKQRFYSRPILTAFETQMFLKLKQTFPQYHVLTQVAFSALITNNDYKVRRLFNRKVTDFVLLDEELNIIVIIELDDPSHLYKQQEDLQRDNMLIEAGYHIFRYTEIPSSKQLIQDLLKIKSRF